MSINSSDSSSNTTFDSTKTSTSGELTFRTPSADDGYPVHQLIARCPPLDTNSIYCNLVQCAHFSNTCVVVEQQGEIVAFLSGYLKPDNPEVLFVWQMAVDQKARGQSLARRMLDHLLSRQALAGVRFIETTITPDNPASQSVFRKLTKSLETQLSEQVLFSRDLHFGGNHNDEVLFTIGPFVLTS